MSDIFDDQPAFRTARSIDIADGTVPVTVDVSAPEPERKPVLETMSLASPEIRGDHEILEAVDSMRKASTHKSLERTPGERDNWVERAGPGGRRGKLPAYVTQIASALERERGFTRSRAIATAVNKIKAWAAGRGNVDANTRAAAAKALGEWNALKAKARAKRADVSEAVLEESLIAEAVWREDLHPRDADGRFRAKVRDLVAGDTILVRDKQLTFVRGPQDAGDGSRRPAIARDAAGAEFYLGDEQEVTRVDPSGDRSSTQGRRGEKQAFYFHELLQQNVPVVVVAGPDKRGTMTVRLPDGRKRKVRANVVSDEPVRGFPTHEIKQTREANTSGGALFGMGNRVYDVTQLEELSQDKPVVKVDPKLFAHAFNRVDIDHDHAMGTDLSRPVLLAERPNGAVALIDGWHRAFRAFTQSKQLQAKILNQGEFESTRVVEADVTEAAKGGGGSSRPAEDEAGWNWRTQGNRRRGVILKNGRKQVVDGPTFDRLVAAGEIDLDKTPALKGDGTKAASARRTGGGTERVDDSRGSSNRSFEELHPRAEKGSPTGGKFIRKDSSGEDVRAVQRKVGSDPTGKFDEKTRQAVKDFQRKRGLTVDGVVGKQTASALLGNRSASKVKTGAIKAGQLDRLRGRGKPKRARAGEARLREDAPYPIEMGSTVRESFSDLSLGRRGTVTSRDVAENGAWIYNVEFEDGEIAEGVRSYDLRAIVEADLREADPAYLERLGVSLGTPLPPPIVLNRVAAALDRELADRRPDPASVTSERWGQLLYRYAMLVATTGKNTTLENVHDAWAAWRHEDQPNHRSIVPFSQLDADTQQMDAPYRDAIVRVARQLRRPTMIALYPPRAVAEKLAVEGGLEPGELHVTLAYLGDRIWTGAELDEIRRTIASVSMSSVGPVEAKVSGAGVFTEGKDAPVTYLSIDSPYLPALRERLVQRLSRYGLLGEQTHGFQPHLTIRYGDLLSSAYTPPKDVSLRFDELVLAVGGRRWTFPLALTAVDDQGIAEAIIEAAFDESKVNRDLIGRFAKKVGALKPNETADLPDGTRVTRIESPIAPKFRVESKVDGEYGYDPQVRLTNDPKGAALAAAEKSAGDTDPKSIGGATRYESLGDLQRRTGQSVTRTPKQQARFDAATDRAQLAAQDRYRENERRRVERERREAELAKPKTVPAVYVTIGKDGKPRYSEFSRGRLWPLKAADAEASFAAGATVYRKKAGTSIWAEEPEVVNAREAADQRAAAAGLAAVGLAEAGDDQPRWPKGHPRGGEWRGTSGSGAGPPGPH